MGEPIKLVKDGKTLVVYGMAQRLQMAAEGWQVEGQNVEPPVVAAEGLRLADDAGNLGMAVADIDSRSADAPAWPEGTFTTLRPEATITPPDAPAVPRGRPKKG